MHTYQAVMFEGVHRTVQYSILSSSEVGRYWRIHVGEADITKFLISASASWLDHTICEMITILGPVRKAMVEEYISQILWIAQWERFFFCEPDGTGVLFLWRCMRYCKFSYFLSAVTCVAMEKAVWAFNPKRGKSTSQFLYIYVVTSWKNMLRQQGTKKNLSASSLKFGWRLNKS